MSHTYLAALRLTVILAVLPFGLAFWLSLQLWLGAGVWAGVTALVVLATYVIDPGNLKSK